MRHSSESPRTPRRKDRGAALLVVIVSTAILTAIAVDLAYSTRVSLLTAANARDELRAEYLARGAVQLSRLVLRFQKQLDDAPIAGAMRVQIFDMVPITSALTDGIFGGPGGSDTAFATEGGDGTAPALDAKGGERGSPAFEAKLEDEGRKVNAQMDAIADRAGPQVEAFLQLIGDARWDPLFDREDEHGQRVTRTDLAVNLHDWTDDDSTGSAFTGSLAKPFENGFGDENQPYYRYDDPYKTKNGRFDSVEELFLVAGIDDAFMAAFGDQLTVFPGKDDPINVNTLDPEELRRLAVLMADPKEQVRLRDPLFPQDLLKRITLERIGGFMKLQPHQLAQIVQSMGVNVNGAYLQPNKTGPFTDRSVAYRIRATGAVGAAERRVDAVVYFSSNPNKPAQEASELGRLLHWREE